MRRASQLALAATVALAAFLIDDHMSFTRPSSLISQAEARAGRPPSATSVAGAARRQGRRAAYAGGVYGAGVYRGGAYAAVAATGSALAIARYRENWSNYGYTGWGDYAQRNGIVCEPGANIKLPDGLKLHLPVGQEARRRLKPPPSSS